MGTMIKHDCKNCFTNITNGGASEECDAEIVGRDLETGDPIVRVYCKKIAERRAAEVERHGDDEIPF